MYNIKWFYEKKSNKIAMLTIKVKTLFGIYVDKISLFTNA